MFENAYGGVGEIVLYKGVWRKEEESEFIGLSILNEEGYLLDYDELKIYIGLNYFIRNVSPELIIKMNIKKQKEDEKQKEKEELIEIVSKNIVDKEAIEESKDSGFFYSIKTFFRKILGKEEAS